MAADFDPAALQALVDGIEGQAAPPGLVEQLRALVRAVGWGWGESCFVDPSSVVQAGDAIRAGDGVGFEQDQRIYPFPQPYAGVAIRDIRRGEIVRWDPIASEFG
jgi:hypothetical protein